MRKRILAIALAAILATAFHAFAVGPPGSGSGSGVQTAADCNVAAYYAIGTLCQDTDDGKLYKGTGAAVAELAAGASGDFLANGSVPMTGPLDLSTAGAVATVGEIGYASNAFSWMAGGTSEKLQLTAGANLWTFSSDTAATFAFTPLVTANAGLAVKNGATGAGFIEIYEDSDDGTNKVTLIAQAMAGDYSWILPNAAIARGSFIIGSSTANALGYLTVGASGKIITTDGTDPAWSTYTVDAPGSAGAVLYSDGTNWTRSASPSLSALTISGASSLGLGTQSANTGSINFKNSANNNTLILQPGETAASITYTLPAAAPTVNGSVLVSTTAGVMSFTEDPSLDTLSLNAANSLALGTMSSAAGSILFKNATNNNIFTVTSGVSTGAIGWTLPTAAAAANNSIVKSSTAGVLAYGPAIGTMTDTYLCKYTAAGTIWSCDVDPAGLGGGYTNLTSFVAQTAWRVFYSDGSGDVKELALGANGTYLMSNGASSAPTFETPAGSGDVTGVGDCAGGACLDGSSDGGTYISLYDGDSHKTSLYAGNSIADLAFYLPTTAGATGGMLYFSAANQLANLAAGTEGYILKMGATIPEWTNSLSVSAISSGGIILGDTTPDADGEIGYASNAYLWFANSEDMLVTASANLWTWSSNTAALFAFTPAVTFTGGITSIGAAANLSGGTVTLGTVAGAINAASATSVAIPTAAGPTVDAAGEIAVDTTTDQLVYYGGAKRVLPYKQFSSFVIAAPAATDDINLLKAPYGMTILAINCIVQGTTSVTGQLQECDSAGANCADLDADIVCDADGAADDGSLTDSAIASAAWLRWKTTSIDGTPTFLTVTVTYSVVSD